MRVKKNNWYFLNGYGGRARDETLASNQVRVFCKKTEYDVLLLVSREVLKEVKYEPAVSGFSILASYKHPYPVYAVGLNTNNYQPILDKYHIEAVFHAK